MATLQAVHRFTHDEVLKMVEAGILTEDDRVELIDGELVDMSPLGDRHNAFVDRATRIFVLGLGDRAIVRVQGDLRLNPYSGPMPDLAVLRPRDDFYANGGAGPADVLLIVEVADSSIVYDTRTKAALYARHMIPEYWVADVNGDMAIVHREPTPQGYARVFSLRGEEAFSPQAFPDLVATVDQLFGR